MSHGITQQNKIGAEAVGILFMRIPAAFVLSKSSKIMDDYMETPVETVTYDVTSNSASQKLKLSSGTLTRR